MTNKEFVLSIYPNAYFSRGTVFAEGPNSRKFLYQDEYGDWAEEWIDNDAIEFAWQQAAECVNRRILRKLES